MTSMTFFDANEDGMGSLMTVSTDGDNAWPVPAVGTEVTFANTSIYHPEYWREDFTAHMKALTNTRWRVAGVNYGASFIDSGTPSSRWSLHIDVMVERISA